MLIKKKIWKEYFEQVKSGEKKFELRLDDFDIQRGDTLILEEWEKDKKEYTGRRIETVVSYVLKTKDVKFWTKEEIEKYGFQVLQIETKIKSPKYVLGRGPVKSFLAAGRGFIEVLIQEASFRFMIFVAFLVLIGMFYFPTSRTEKVSLLTMIFAVLGLELVNSVIERLLDFIESKYNERVRLIKDLMAAIVLLVSIGATIIGFFIFIPYFIRPLT